MKRILLAIAALVVANTLALAATDTGTSTMSVTVGAEADFTTVGATSLATTGSVFNAYTGTTSFTYKLRTTQTSGAGDIKVQITSDFSGTGAPDADSGLTYTCTITTPGTGCSGSQTASSSSQTAVATFADDAHSTDSGDSGTLSWSLENKPAYKTGSYSATATFTISAT